MTAVEFGSINPYDQTTRKDFDAARFTYNSFFVACKCLHHSLCHGPDKQGVMRCAACGEVCIK